MASHSAYTSGRKTEGRWKVTDMTGVTGVTGVTGPSPTSHSPDGVHFADVETFLQPGESVRRPLNASSIEGGMAG